MEYRIKIMPSGICFQSEDNILDDALKQSIPLQHSCKSGECTSCSATIISGKTINELGDVVQEGTILTCKSKALSDLVLEANYYPELARQNIQTLPSKVESFEFVTNDILVIKLRFPPTANFTFLPGQYVDLNFKGIKRSYSIANSRELSKGLELHIRQVANGQMSEALFSGIKENALMRIEGPKGTFFIRKSDKPLILLAGGTGIAPIKAMIESLIANKDKRQIHLYWGMNNKNSFYLNKFNELAISHSNVHYSPVLSGNEKWDGRMGLVHQAVYNDFSDLSGHQIYACGSLAMINVAKDAFIKKALPENHFFSDAFTATK